MTFLKEVDRASEIDTVGGAEGSNGMGKKEAEPEKWTGGRLRLR